MRLCLPARMGGGGKAESTPLARASGRTATATRGWLFCFENERAKPLAFPHHQMNGGGQPPLAATRQNNGTLAQNDASRMPCARACGPAGVRQGEWQERQRVSTKLGTLKEREARERVRPQTPPLIFPRSRSSPEGPRLEAWFASVDRAGCPKGSAR
jgi:hypothetical protein